MGGEESRRAIVVDTFSISGRGTAVLLDCLMNLPAAEIRIRVNSPDGDSFECVGHPEFVLRRDHELTGILVRDLPRERFPIGSTIEILPGNDSDQVVSK